MSPFFGELIVNRTTSMNTKLDTDTGISCSTEVVSKENVPFLKLFNSPIVHALMTLDTTFIIHTGNSSHTPVLWCLL